jgi:hypothetical protein
MDANGLDAMFIFTVSMGVITFLMAWIIVVVSIKGWAVRRELASKLWVNERNGKGEKRWKEKMDGERIWWFMAFMAHYDTTLIFTMLIGRYEDRLMIIFFLLYLLFFSWLSTWWRDNAVDFECRWMYTPWLCIEIFSSNT